MPDHEPEPSATPPPSQDGPLQVFRGPTSGFHQYATSVVWSPDGHRLAAAFGDNTVHIWEVKRPDLMHILQGHRNGISAVDWSFDGQRLASAGCDGTVRVWDTSTGDLLLTHQQENIWMLTTAWSPDGRWLAAAGNALNVSRKDPHHHVSLWDAASGELVRQLTQATGAVQSVTWSPDGRRLASGGFDRLVRVWEAASGDLVLTCEGQGSPINAVAWSPDGRWLASGADDAGWIGMEDAVCLWDATTGTLLRRLPGHNRVARAVAWAPEGRRLASAGGDLYAGESYRPEDPDYKIRIWEAATGHLLTALQGHFHEVNALAWSPCGQRLASASSDGSVRVWWVG